MIEKFDADLEKRRKWETDVAQWFGFFRGVKIIKSFFTSRPLTFESKKNMQLFRKFGDCIFYIKR